MKRCTISLLCLVSLACFAGCPAGTATVTCPDDLDVGQRQTGRIGLNYNTDARVTEFVFITQSSPDGGAVVFDPNGTATDSFGSADAPMEVVTQAGFGGREFLVEGVRPGRVVLRLQDLDGRQLSVCEFTVGAAGSDDMASAPSGCNEPGDFSGTWDVTFTNISSFCGPESDDSFVVTITQSDCTVTMTGIKDSSQAVTGTIAGDVATFPATDFSEAGGTTTSAFRLELSGDELLGSETWSFAAPGESCTNGNSLILANRRP